MAKNKRRTPTPEPISEARQTEIRRAIVRIAFGQIQMIGAVIGFYLLLRTGVTSLSVAVVTVTTIATIVSRILFRKKGP